MDSFKNMDQAWRSYAEQVVPFNAPHAQRMENRRAFYSGAQALLHGIVMNFLDPGIEPTDADVEKLERLSEELEKFGADVLAKRA